MSASSSSVSAALKKVDPWLDRRPRPPGLPPELRIFCFPYAGGGAGVFRAWHGAFGPQVETVPVRPPGRESRISEPALNRMEPLADGAAAALEPLVDVPYVLFGHSLGSLVALEVAHRLTAVGRPPAMLMASGRRAPHLPLAQPAVHHRPEPDLLAELRRMGGTPEQLFRDRELMDLLLPLIRADFAVFETYVPTERDPLPCPIAVFGGDRDRDVEPAHLDAWRSYGNGALDMHMFSGGHFFLQEAGAEALRSTVGGILADLQNHVKESNFDRNPSADPVR